MGNVVEVLIEVASFLGAIALLLGFIALGAFPTALLSLRSDTENYPCVVACLYTRSYSGVGLLSPRFATQQLKVLPLLRIVADMCCRLVCTMENFPAEAKLHTGAYGKQVGLCLLSVTNTEQKSAEPDSPVLSLASTV